MSTDGEFIVSFIANAVSNGVNPLDAAKEEITEIDKTLNEAEKLKLRRLLLISVLEHFDDDTYRRRRSISIPASGDIFAAKELEDLQAKIRNAIEEKGPLTVRDIIYSVGSYDEDVLIMRTVKEMGDLEILSRNEDGLIQQGKNW